MRIRKPNQRLMKKRVALINHGITNVAKAVFSFFSSLKTAIPLLVVTIAVTIGGSLLPTTDFFKTWWYLGLLALNGVSLLFVTVLHIPLILVRKGRNALIGVLATHLGILILIAGVIYGGVSGFRYDVKAIEDEMTIVPGLSFVIRLDELIVEEYLPEETGHLDPEFVPKKRQESHLSFFRSGKLLAQAVAAPGIPANLEGATILPAFTDIGWYIELIVTDHLQRNKTVPVKPWAPAIFEVRNTPLMAHSVAGDGEFKTQVFTRKGEEIELLGVVGAGQDLAVEDHSISLGSVKRYTGLAIYNRPHMPVLVAGCLVMLFGLVWHFYFRHRDRRTKE